MILLIQRANGTNVILAEVRILWRSKQAMVGLDWIQGQVWNDKICSTSSPDKW